MSSLIFLTATLHLSSACVPGFRYIPPIDTTAADANTRQCQVCKKGLDEVSNSVWTSRGLSENPSPRFGWPPPATTTTAAPLPCCGPNANPLANTTDCGQATVNRIVGGQEATENQLPWQCSIYNGDGTWYGCGATLISCDPVIIISAAHCFTGANASPNGKKVVCGDWKRDTTDTNEQSLAISQIINHPSYNINTQANDISILKVTGSFTCSQGKVYPACLPSVNKYAYEGWADTITSGWGTTTSGGSISNTLRYVKVPPVSDATCNEPASYNGQIDATTMICAGLQAGGKDACQGDSGGPLVTKADGVDQGYSLIGVVSFGEGCAAPNKYGVYAEFSNYLTWVAQTFGLTPPTRDYA